MWQYRVKFLAFTRYVLTSNHLVHGLQHLQSFHNPCSDALHCLGSVWHAGNLCHTGSWCWSWPCFPPDVLVYTLAWDSDAQLRGKDSIHVERRLTGCGGLWENIIQCCKGSLGVEVQLVAVTSGSPRAPAPAVPDTQMGQIVSLSALGAEEANSLIWSLLMESLEGAFSHSPPTSFLSLPLLPNWKFPLVPLTKPRPVGERDLERVLEIERGRL